MKHRLKIKKMYFDRIVSGEKKFEVRLNDRDYQVGDLIAFEPIAIYGSLEVKIIYIHAGLGMADNYVILGIEVLQ